MESRTWQASGLFLSSPPQCFCRNVLYFYVLLYIAFVEENKLCYVNYVMLFMRPYLGLPWTNSCQIWCVRVFHHALLKYGHENAEIQKRKFDVITLQYSICVILLIVHGTEHYSSSSSSSFGCRAGDYMILHAHRSSASVAISSADQLHDILNPLDVVW